MGSSPSPGTLKRITILYLSSTSINSLNCILYRLKVPTGLKGWFIGYSHIFNKQEYYGIGLTFLKYFIRLSLFITTTSTIGLTESNYTFFRGRITLYDDLQELIILTTEKA